MSTIHHNKKDKLSEETINKLVENTHLLVAYQATTDSLIEKIKELQKLLEVQSSYGVWKPIETAPKDGTFILVWSDTGINEVFWSEEDEFWYHDVDADDIWPLRGGYPTMWTELPHEPQE